jgi:uncharacterized protein
MSQSPETPGNALPVVDYLKIPERGPPYLEGSRCGDCDAVYLGTRAVCGRCGARGKMQTNRLSSTGTLYTYAIVHRSFPDVTVPFISAIVDLDGGGTVKGNLLEVEPEPASIRFDMPVEVVFREALGRRDQDGNRYLSYFFVPRR